jgi:hypothetical protein
MLSSITGPGPAEVEGRGMWTNSASLKYEVQDEGSGGFRVWRLELGVKELGVPGLQLRLYMGFYLGSRYQRMEYNSHSGFRVRVWGLGDR